MSVPLITNSGSTVPHNTSTVQAALTTLAEGKPRSGLRDGGRVALRLPVLGGPAVRRRQRATCGAREVEPCAWWSGKTFALVHEEEETVAS